MDIPFKGSVSTLNHTRILLPRTTRRARITALFLLLFLRVFAPLH
jgi:hypothetical protein